MWRHVKVDFSVNLGLASWNFACQTCCQWTYDLHWFDLPLINIDHTPLHHYIVFLRLENWTSLTEAHLQRKPLDDYQTQSNTIKQLNNRGYTGQPNSIQLHMEFPWNFLLPIMALAHFIHLISFDHEMPGRTLWQYSLDDCPKRVKFLEGNSQCERSDIKKNCMTIDNNWHPRDNWLTSMTHWHIDTMTLSCYFSLQK